MCQHNTKRETESSFKSALRPFTGKNISGNGMLLEAFSTVGSFDPNEGHAKPIILLMRFNSQATVKLLWCWQYLVLYPQRGLHFIFAPLMFAFLFPALYPDAAMAAQKVRAYWPFAGDSDLFCGTFYGTVKLVSLTGKRFWMVRKCSIISSTIKLAIW